MLSRVSPGDAAGDDNTRPRPSVVVWRLTRGDGAMRAAKF